MTGRDQSIGPSDYAQQMEERDSMMPIVNEALRLNMWLYNKDNGHWYTPEEFTMKYRNTEISDYELTRVLKGMMIRDPRTGNTAYHKEIEKRIEQFHQEINALRTKGENFLNKVVSYYQEKRGRQ